MTEILKINDATLYEKAVGYLNKGGVIIYPTETLYGIGCLATDEEACDRILDVKGRPENKGLIVLVRDEEMLEKYFVINKKVLEKYSSLKKPLTMILGCRIKFPGVVSAGTGNVAVRISSSDFVRELFKHIDQPITSTSANISGGGNLSGFKDIREQFINKVDLIIDSGNIPPSKGSAIVDLTKNPHEIIRTGDLSESEIKEFISG